jgi:hypothetical protein
MGSFLVEKVRLAADWWIGGLADWRIGGLADWCLGGLRIGTRGQRAGAHWWESGGKSRNRRVAKSRVASRNEVP